MQRHGGMVLGVARRVLHHQQDAEDVFQATFLILARKATSIRRQESVGAWLHQVAQRVALKARSNIAKRKQRERREPVSTSNLDDVTWRELISVGIGTHACSTHTMPSVLAILAE